MKCLVIVSCVLALATAKPGGLGLLGPYAAPYGAHLAAPYAAHIAAPYAAAPVAVAHAVAPVAVGVAASSSSQHHAQDTLGQYSYGYAHRNSQKQEVRTADGITRGGYSYVDGHGIVQSANYVADGLGFRVAATNLPVGPAAPAAPFAAVAPYGHLYRKKRSVGLVGPAAVGYAAAPVALAAPAPIAVAAPVYVEPVRSFGYSTATVHADPAIVPAPIDVAHAAPVAVAHAAPLAVAHAAPLPLGHAATLGAVIHAW